MTEPRKDKIGKIVESKNGERPRGAYPVSLVPKQTWKAIGTAIPKAAYAVSRVPGVPQTEENLLNSYLKWWRAHPGRQVLNHVLVVTAFPGVYLVEMERGKITRYGIGGCFSVPKSRRIRTQNIAIAMGQIRYWKKAQFASRIKAIQKVFFVLGHELAHYRQWCFRKFSPATREQRATRLGQAWLRQFLVHQAQGPCHQCNQVKVEWL